MLHYAHRYSPAYQDPDRRRGRALSTRGYTRRSRSDSEGCVNVTSLGFVVAPPRFSFGRAGGTPKMIKQLEVIGKWNSSTRSVTKMLLLTLARV
jgi:hypothetical protein